MKKIIFSLALLLYSNILMASSTFPNEFIYMMGAYYVGLLSPIVLSLFFIKNGLSKTKQYFVFLIIIYGVKSIVHLPFELASTLGISLGQDLTAGIGLVMMYQILALSLSIFILKKTSRSIVAYIAVEKHNPHQKE